MDVSLSRKRELLLDEIAEEERLIRIHTAELARDMSLAVAQQPHVDDDDEEDLLETLDALQSSGTAASIMLESKLQDDPMLHRLLPLIGGVAFTSVRALQSSSSSSSLDATTTTITTRRSYEFQGNIVGNANISFTIICHVECCCCSHETTTSTKARVVELTTTFSTPTSSSCSKELDQISKVASEMCSIPLLFRHLVSWADFDSRRTLLLRKCQETYGCTAVKRLSAESFCIEIVKNEITQCSLQLLWTWSYTWYEQGREELSVETCNVSPRVNHSELGQWLREIRNPQGLNNLVATAGSCEQALHLLMKALLGTP